MKTQTTATAYKVNTIDINAKEWFDKANGNSYFSGQIIVNYKLENEKRFFMPFQYGYGDFYLWQSLETLKAANILPEYVVTLHQLQDAGTIIRYNKLKALKRELKEENF